MGTWIIALHYSDVHLNNSQSSLYRCAPAWIQLFTTATSFHYPTVNLHSYTFYYSKIHLCCHFHKWIFAGNTCLTIHMYTWTSILQRTAHLRSQFCSFLQYMKSPFQYLCVQMSGTFYCRDQYMDKLTSCITFEEHFKPLV